MGKFKDYLDESLNKSKINAQSLMKAMIKDGFDKDILYIKKEIW